MIRIPTNRRAFITGAGALAAGFALPRIARGATGPGKKPILLTARQGSARLLETADKHTPIWGYRGTAPGPLLRFKQGQELWVRLKNELPQPTTIHWHGIRIDNVMDGVAGLTQDAVPPGETFDYRFSAPDAGTFWYHPHNRSWEQLARGLYGALIVDEPDPPAVDQDIIVIADDWFLGDDGQIHEASLGSIRDRAHAGRLGNILTLNGKPRGIFPVVSGERIRLRLINSCNARILEFRFEQLKPLVIALDGQPVAPNVLNNETVRIAPAQRIDLAIDMTGPPGSTHAITEVSQSRLVAGEFVYDPKTTRALRGTPLTLPENSLPAPAEAHSKSVDLVMSGGAMGRMEKASYKGTDYEIRELVRRHGMVWAFNGIAGMGAKPLFTARRGESVAVRMVNDTRWPHAMHFHGHHFRETDGPWRDTLLIEPQETRKIGFVADNPGKWMIHCHMLEHQAGGMATWFEVT